jgi:hypothetical protein
MTNDMQTRQKSIQDYTSYVQEGRGQHGMLCVTPGFGETLAAGDGSNVVSDKSRVP